MQANSRQIDGTHYASAYQHWDFVELTGMGYLEGCATKYLMRWRSKGGQRDLLKSEHYVEKLREMHLAGVRKNRLLQNIRLLRCSLERFGFWKTIRQGLSPLIEVELELFLTLNGLDDSQEAKIIRGLLFWRTDQDLAAVLEDYEPLILEAV